MNLLLLKNRPKDTTKEEFSKNWENVGYSLEALYKTLQDLSSTTNKVREDDFSVANHYALLAFQAGKRQAYQEVIDMLPDTAKNIF